MGRDFTIGGLVAWITRLKDAGYGFGDYAEAPPSSGTVILRHDVDLDLECAVEVAVAEASLGVRSTFFILTTAQTYNVMSVRGRSQCQMLLNAGHRVGLHFDSAGHGPGDLISALLQQRSVLETALGQKVAVFSNHRTVATGLDLTESVGGLTSASAADFRHEIAYSTDSGGWWRYGRFLDSTDFGSRRSVQLLLHPEWWTGTPDEHPAERLHRLADRLSEGNLDAIRQTIGPFREYDGGRAGLGHEWSAANDGLRP